MGLPFVNAITWCNKPNLSNNTCSYITIDCPIVSFTSNSPTITCMGTQLSFRKLITKAKVSTLSWDVHKSKLAETTFVDAKFDKTRWTMVLLTMFNNTSSTIEDRKGNKTWGHWHNTNLQSQIFLSGQGHVTLANI